MATELQQMLYERAGKDYQALTVVHALLPNPARVREAWRQILANVLEDAAAQAQGRKSRATMLYMPVDMVEVAANMGINMAGEAIKNLEKENPEIIRQNPDFPWTEFKKLRDVLCHPGRKSNAKDIAKQEQKLLKFKDKYRPETLPKDNVHVINMLRGLRYTAAIDTILKAHEGKELIPLTWDPAVTKACEILGGGLESGFPALVIVGAETARCNMFGEQLAKLSPLYTRSGQASLNSSTVQYIIDSRNDFAHFNNFFDNKNNGGPFIRDMFAFQQATELPKKRMDKMMPGKDAAPEKIEAFIAKLAREYEKQLMGNATLVPQKVALMDETVRWVKNGSKYMDAPECNFLTVVGRMLQRTQPEQAEAILRQVFKVPAAVRESALLESAPDVPENMRHSLREFARDITRLQPPKASVA